MRNAALLLALALALDARPPALAQIESDPFSELSPARQRSGDADAPSLVFHLLAEIPLPGPLPPTGPRWVDGRIEIAVPGGTAVVEPVSGSVTRLLDPPPPVPGSAGEAWVLDARGSRRFRSLPPHLLVAEKRRSRSFRTDWRLRSPGLSASPPLVLDDRVCFGGSDNRVSCVKARNGHRIWSRDVEARVTRRLVSRTAAGGSEAVVLAVLDEGESLLVLSAKSGATVSSCDFSGAGLLMIDVPAMSAEGIFAVALQAYDPALASLRIYSLDPIAPDASPDSSAAPASIPRTTTSG